MRQSELYRFKSHKLIQEMHARHCWRPRGTALNQKDGGLLDVAATLRGVAVKNNRPGACYAAKYRWRTAEGGGTSLLT